MTDESMDMVERVARAIGDALLTATDEHELAHAAIDAMRKPTPVMVEAGEANVAGREDVRYIWAAMIDAAGGRTDA